MNIFKSIRLGISGPAGKPRPVMKPRPMSKPRPVRKSRPSGTSAPSKLQPVCQNCIHFQNDPAHIEAIYPGLTIMSSGFASVRDQDGLCNYHQLYLSAKDSCPQIECQPDTSR